jgi:hypothetical protein
MLSKAAVEFSALLEREIELGFLLGRGKAVPEGHSDVDPLRSRQVQELRQGVPQDMSDPPTAKWATQGSRCGERRR